MIALHVALLCKAVIMYPVVIIGYSECNVILVNQGTGLCLNEDYIDSS